MFLQFRREIVEISFNNVIGHHSPELIEPPYRHLVQAFAFVWYAVWENAVECRNSVCCNKENLVSEVVNVPYLALPLRERQVCLRNNFHHPRSSLHIPQHS